MEDDPVQPNNLSMKKECNFPVNCNFNEYIDSFYTHTNTVTQSFFWQQYQTKKESGEDHGGIRGVAWRTVYRKKLYKIDNIL